MKEYSIQLALKNVADYAGIKGRIELLQEGDICVATIVGRSFAVLYKPAITTQTFGGVIRLAADLHGKSKLPVLAISESVSANVMDRLFNEGISVAETSGNCKISDGQLFINVTGQKKCIGANLNKQSYTDTKLKVIFYFLLDKENISQPFRQISEHVGVSLSTIKQVVDDLVSKTYVVSTSKGRMIKNRKGLIELWSLHYNQVMKPKLLLSKFDFVRKEDKIEWRDIALPDGMAWGGEPAAQIIDGYLKPELFEIYSSVPGINLISTQCFKPNPNGDVAVYDKFWPGHDGDVVPDIIVYADLMGTGDSRCVEAAQRLLDKIENW